MTNEIDTNKPLSPIFSPKEFKKVIQIKENVVDALRQFLEQSKSHEDGQSDVVLELLKSEDSLGESSLVKLLDEKLKPSEAVTVISFFHAILHRIVDDIGQYELWGLAVTKQLLYPNRISRLKRGLMDGDHLVLNKVTLKLFTAMVGLGVEAARDVIKNLPLNAKLVKPLLYKIDNVNKASDVCSMTIDFLIAFFDLEDDDVTSKLVEQKGLLNDVFDVLPYLRAPAIQDFLAALTSQVVDNKSIYKTLKIAIFNNATLLPVMRLLDWKGPRPFKLKKKKNRKGDMPSEELTEEIATIRQLAREFILSVLSPRTGITFHDPTCGTSAENSNHLLIQLLPPAYNQVKSPMMADVIVQVLKWCPDQVYRFFSQLRDQLTPRLTPQWMGHMAAVRKIIAAQDLPAILAAVDPLLPVESRVRIVLRLTTVQDFRGAVSKEMICNSDLAMRHESLLYVVAVLEQVERLCGIDATEAHKLLGCDLKTFHSAWWTKLSVMLPSFDDVCRCWALATKKSSVEIEEAEAADSVAIAPIDLYGHFQNLINVIAIFYRQTSPRSTVQCLAEIWGSLEHVHRLLGADKAMEIQISISRLVVDAGLGKSLLLQKVNGRNAVFVILELINRDLEQSVRVSLSSLLEQLLLSTKHFDADELKMILRLFLAPSARSDTVLQFLHDVLVELVDNFQEVEDSTKAIQADETSTTQDEVYEKMLEDMLESDMEGDETAVEELKAPLDYASRKPCLSSLVFLCLHKLDSVDDDNEGPSQEFVTAFLYDVLHSHEQRQAFCALLTQGHLSLPKELHRYIPHLDPSKPYHSLPKVKGRKHNHVDQIDFTTILRRSFETNSPSSVALEDDDEELEELIGSLTDYDMFIAYRQTLCYIELLLEKEDGDVNLFSRFCHVLTKLASYFNDHSAPAPTSGDLLSNNSTRDRLGRESLLNRMETALISSPSISKTFLNWNLLADTACHKATAASELVLNLAARVTPDRTNLIADCRAYQDRATDFVRRAMRLSTTDRPSTLIPSVRAISPFLPRLPPATFRNVIDADWSPSTDSGKTDLGELLVLLLDHLAQSQRHLVATSNDRDYDDVTTRVARSLHDLLSANRLYAFLVSREYFQSLLDTLAMPFHSQLARLLLESDSENLVVFENWLQEHGVPEEVAPFHPLAAVFLGKLTSESISASESRSAVTKVLAKYYWSRLVDSLAVSEEDAELSDDLVSGLLTAIVGLELVSVRKQSGLIEKSVGPTSAKRLRVLSRVHSSIGKNGITIRGYSPASCDVVASLKAVVDWFAEELSGSVTHRDDCLTVVDAVMATLSDKESQLPALGELIHAEKLSQRLIKTTLKVALTNPAGAGALRLLAVLLGRLHHDGQAAHFMAGSIFELLLGHSNFLPGLLSKDPLYLEWKNGLLDLLVLLTDMDPTVCRATLVPMYLSVYGASLSPADQKLLRLLYVCEAQGVDCASYRPFLWGEAAATHYSLLKDMRHTLMKQPTTMEILGLLKFERLLKTAYNFPLTLPLALDATAPRTELDADLYDPRFLLPLFSQLVAPESILHTWWFINSNAMSVVFAALGSEDDRMRAAAYHVIKDLYAHLEGSRFAQSAQWMYLFDWLANGIPTPNLRLSNLITIFLLEMTRLLLDPTQPTCPPMIAFLTVKPALDVYRVPNFIQMFHLTDHKLQAQCRAWILALLRDGLRVPGDYALCNKYYVFKMVMGFLKSHLSARTHVPQILEVVRSAVRVPGIADDMFGVRGLTPFLLSVLPECDAAALVMVVQILDAAAGQLVTTGRDVVLKDILFLLVRALPCLNPRLPDDTLETAAATMASVVERDGVRSDMLTAASVQQLLTLYGESFREPQDDEKSRGKLAANLCSVLLSWNCEVGSTTTEGEARSDVVFLPVCRLLLTMAGESVETLGKVYQWIEDQLRRDRSGMLVALLVGRGGGGVVDGLLRSYGRLLVDGVGRNSLCRLNRVFLLLRTEVQRGGNEVEVGSEFLVALGATERTCGFKKLARRMDGEDELDKHVAAVSISKLILDLWMRPDVHALLTVVEKFLSPVSANSSDMQSPASGSTKRSCHSESTASAKSKRRKLVHV